MNEYHLGGLITINSIFHFLFPMVFGLFLGRKWYIGILVLALFECIENTSGVIISIGSWTIFSPEPFINIASDLIIGTLGLYIGMRLSQKK